MARQYQIPGGPYVLDDEDGKTYQIPGYSYLNSVSGEQAYTGSGALAPASTIAGSGTYAAPVTDEYAGSGALAPASTISGTGDYAPPEYGDIGSGSELITHSVISGAGTYEAPAGTHTGSGALLGGSVIDGAGTYEAPVPTYTGSGALVGGASITGSADVPRSTKGFAGGYKPWATRINGELFVGTRDEIERLVREYAEAEAEKDVEADKPPKRPKIKVLSGKPVQKVEQQEVQPSEWVYETYFDAYRAALLIYAARKQDEDDEEAMAVL